MQRNDADKFYKRILGSRCTYCGEYANCGDHAYPIAAFLRGHRPERKEMLTVVPACRECNSVAVDWVLGSINAKRRFVQRKLREKYSDILNMPDWTQAELEELSWELRKYIEDSLVMKKRIPARTTWEPAVSVERVLKDGVSGKGSVQIVAEQRTIREKQRRPVERGEPRKVPPKVDIGWKWKWKWETEEPKGFAALQAGKF